MKISFKREDCTHQDGITCSAWIVTTDTAEQLPEGALIGFVAKRDNGEYIVNIQILGIRVTYQRRHAIKPFITKTLREHGFNVA